LKPPYGWEDIQNNINAITVDTSGKAEKTVEDQIGLMTYLSVQEKVLNSVQKQLNDVLTKVEKKIDQIAAEQKKNQELINNLSSCAAATGNLNGE
jgi:hypothetical protein